MERGRRLFTSGTDQTRLLRFRRRPAVVSGVLLVGVLGVLLAACSSSGSAAPTSTSASSKTSSSSSSSATAYRNCLSQHGVTLPNFSHGGGASGTGGFGEGGSRPSGSGGFGGFANNPKFAAAEKACASLRPKGGFGGGFGRGGANSTAFAAYRNCLKLHGVTLPAPGSTPSSSPPTTLDTSSATYQAAAAACASLRPKPNSTTSTTG